MPKNAVPGVYVGSLITSVIGAILLLATDFASWYNYSNGTEEWGWISADDSIPAAILLVILALCLLYCSYISFLGLQTTNEEPTKDKLRLGLILSGFVFLVVLIGGLIFVGVMLSDEPSEWGLEAGFYAGLLGSFLTALFLYIAYKE